MATPEQIQWVRTITQPNAAVLASAYFQAKQDVASWFALSMGDIIPNTSEVMCESDGGHAITGAMVVNFITRQQELIADYEANSSAKLNTILQAARGFV